ncbi:carbohydrate ABC transporter permease [Nonomuraea sp. NPDC050680]|uniref:carbohydrate ABC transporter permease n=1 Tax=Nonomuraea sp. NPDC050680 TaxID=3154630 RepID=UPI0033C84843
MTRIVRYTILALGGLIFLFPFYFMIITSVSPPGSTGSLVPPSLDFSTWTFIFAKLPITWNLLNSAVYTLGVVSITLVIGSLTGYALARLSFRGRDALFAVILFTLALPFQLLMVPLFIMVSDWGWARPGPGNYLALIFPMAVNATAIIIFRQFFRGLPQELFDAAYLDGAGNLRILWKIAIPLTKPAFLIATLITFIGPWNDFLWGLLVVRDTYWQPLSVAVGILGSGAHATAGGGNYWGTVTAASTLLAVPVIVLFIAFQRYFVRGVIEDGIKG